MKTLYGSARAMRLNYIGCNLGRPNLFHYKLGLRRAETVPF